VPLSRKRWKVKHLGTGNVFLRKKSKGIKTGTPLSKRDNRNHAGNGKSFTDQLLPRTDHKRLSGRTVEETLSKGNGVKKEVQAIEGGSGIPGFKIDRNKHTEKESGARRMRKQGETQPGLEKYRCLASECYYRRLCKVGESRRPHVGVQLDTPSNNGEVCSWSTLGNRDLGTLLAWQ